MRSAAMRFCAVGMWIAGAAACSDKAGPPEDDSRAVPIQHNVTESGVVEQARELGARGDHDVYQLGRADTQLSKLDTYITMNLTGMSPWAVGDSLQIVSPNTALVMGGPENEFASYPAAGDTAVRGQTLNWRTAFAPVIDAAKGDSTIVTQLVSTGAGSRRYSAIARAGTAHGFTVHDGHPGTLAAVLSPVAADRELTLGWKGRAFAALAGDVGPGARAAAAGTVAISALPDVLARNNAYYATYYTGLPNLVSFAPLPGASDVDVAVRYGNPFATLGARWTELVTVVYSYIVPITTDAGVTTMPARAVVAMPVDALEAGSLAPAISPVRNVQINQQAFDSGRTGVGPSPTISWQAPAIGTPTTYVVSLGEVGGKGALRGSARPNEVGSSGAFAPNEVGSTGAFRANEVGSNGAFAPNEVGSTGAFGAQTAGTFVTKSTSLEIPRGSLIAGTTYVVMITAIAAPSADLTKQPYVATLPFASADHITATFTP